MGTFMVIVLVLLVVGLVFYMTQRRSASSPASYERSSSTNADTRMTAPMDMGATTDTGTTTSAQARSYDADPDAPNDVIGGGGVDGGGARYNESGALIGGIASNVQPEVSSGDDRPSYEKNN